MPILIDTNVILDIVIDDPTWARRADETLRIHGKQGAFINPIIYAELCTGAPTQKYVDEVVQDLKLDCCEIPHTGLWIAAKAYQLYRTRGGTKNAPLPDFFIGAHAAVAQMRLLTRDPARYRTYFPTVELVAP